MEFENGKLYVGKVKRNIADMKRSGIDQARKGRRLVMALDVPGKEGLGDELVTLWATGKLKLPEPLLNKITDHKAGKDALQKVGNKFSELLNNVPAWSSLKAEKPGLVPYSLRHGWAWRSQTADRPLNVRDAAALLGHSPTTFYKHYGAWTNEKDLIAAVAAFRSGSRESA